MNWYHQLIRAKFLIDWTTRRKFIVGQVFARCGLRTDFLNSHVPSTCLLLSVRWCYQWWRHEMETLSALLNHCHGKHLSPANSLHKWPAMRTFDVSLTLTQKNCLSNTPVAGDVRRDDSHVTSLWCVWHYCWLCAVRSHASSTCKH